jgi:glutamate dehydrogenase
LIAAFRAVRAGELDDDGFNRLLIAAELSMRRSRCCVPAAAICCRRASRSASYMERVLAAHAHTARALCLLFEQRLTPGVARSASAHPLLEQRIRRAIEALISPDEDRILRAFLAVIRSTLRTNYFRRDAAGPATSVAVAEARSEPHPGSLPRPLPGVRDLRAQPAVRGLAPAHGSIARGGIRWSERPEDFRTEILGLMKAQHVKNTVIVPVGAKGGFVARRLARARRASCSSAKSSSAIESFIRALLDLTDNIVGGRVVPPAQVRRLDGDDPYLVVAADKGTATSPTSPTRSPPNMASGSATPLPRAARAATTTRKWASRRVAPGNA